MSEDNSEDNSAKNKYKILNWSKN